jgi:hypothetical protein
MNDHRRRLWYGTAHSLASNIGIHTKSPCFDIHREVQQNLPLPVAEGVWACQILGSTAATNWTTEGAFTMDLDQRSTRENDGKPVEEAGNWKIGPMDPSLAGGFQQLKPGESV